MLALFACLHGHAFAASDSEKWKTIHREFRAFVEEHQPEEWKGESLAKGLKTREEFKGRLREMSAGSEAAEAYLFLAVEYLLRFPAENDFGRVFWRVAALTEVQESMANPILSTRLGPRMLELLEGFPQQSEIYVKGRLLAAAHHHRAQEFAEEQEILEELLKSESLALVYKVRVLERLAGNALVRKDHERATRLFLRAGRFANADIGAASSLLRAAILQLELGEFDAALKTVRRLKAVPELVRADADTSYSMKALSEIAATPAKARAYWKSGETWMEAWLELVPKLSGGGAPEEIRLAALPAPKIMAQQIMQAAQDGNAAAFIDRLDLLARATRWAPHHFRDFASTLVFVGPRLAPELRTEVYEFALLLCNEFSSPLPEFADHQELYKVVALVELEEADAALEGVQAYLTEKGGFNDPVAQGMLRLWAHIAATKEEGMQKPAELIEQLLQQPEVIDLPQTIIALAQLYRKLGEREKEVALLKAGIDRVADAPDEPAKAALIERYDSMVRDDEEVADFEVGIKEWLDRYEPAWVNHCPPTDWNDPRFAEGRDAVIESPGNEFSREEVIKLRLLACADPDIDYNLRLRSFRSAFLSLLDTARTHAEFRKLIRSVVNNSLFDVRLRQIVLTIAMEDAVRRGDKGDMAFYLTHQDFDRNNPRIAEALGVYGQYLECDLQDAGELEACIEVVASEEIGPSQLVVISQALERLLEMGEIERTRKIARAMEEWRFQEGFGIQRDNLRMEVVRTIDQAATIAPLSAAMDSIARESFPEIGSVEPADAVTEWRDLRDLDFFPAEEAKRIRLTQIQSGDYPKIDPEFWIQFAESLPQGEETFAFNFQLLKMLLAETKADLPKSLAALAAPGIIDTDEPDLLARLREIFKPWRQREELPMTFAAIKSFDIQTGIRLGKKYDIAKTMDGLEHPIIDRTIPRLELVHYYNTGRKAKLVQALDALTPEQMTDPMMLPIIIPVLRSLDREESLRVAEEEARKALPVQMAAAWRTMQTFRVFNVYALAHVLNAPEGIPKEFEAACLRNLRNERINLMVRIAHARVNKNWAAMETAANEAIELFPTFYHFYFLHGEALWNLDRKSEAKERFDVYLRYGYDEMDYTKAVKMVEEWEHTKADSPNG
ncbi:MAG: hypothetical protein AAGA58_05680 [Verrucomicrobiota bacterium]